MIELQDINKSFRVARRKAGLGNAFKSLFSREYETIQALDHVSFSINDGEMVAYIGPTAREKAPPSKSCAAF